MTQTHVRSSRATTKKSVIKSKKISKGLITTSTSENIVKKPRRPAVTEFIDPKMIYRASPLERIEMVRKGVPRKFLRIVAKMLHMSRGQLNQTLKISRHTKAQKTRANKLLNQAQSELLIGIVRLVGQIEEIMAEAGTDESFNAGAWLTEWIAEPLPALGNLTAGDFMDTTEGQRLISHLLSQSVAGAYV